MANYAKCPNCGAINEIIELKGSRDIGCSFIARGKCNSCGVQFTTTQFWIK